MSKLPRYRVFLSSPGDVTIERQKAALVLDRLRKAYARHLHIEPYLWEYEPMLASGHFQDVIDLPSSSDLVILVLWSRLGTPLPERTAKREYRGMDGRTPVTGTEWEFEEALAGYRSRGAPDLLVYKSRKEPAPPRKLRDRHAYEQALTQLEALDAFWERHFAEKGAFKTAYSSYGGHDEFEAKLESDVRKRIEDHLGRLPNTLGSRPQVTPWSGNPFRGLEGYTFEHAAVYFGRGRAIDVAISRLQRGAERGLAFILVLGASGCGKSSLAQAGILPALSIPAVSPGVGQWRRAIMKPSDAPDPFIALSQALLRPEAIPEIGNSEERRSRLPASLQGGADELVRRALEDVTELERSCHRVMQHEHVALALVVDQLEELYTRNDLTGNTRIDFINTLRILAASGVVHVVATMRSDQWHRVAETPDFIHLTEGDRRLDLLPASPAELTEILRDSAEAAGITFEQDPSSGLGLDAMLAEEAAREPGALPLLSYLLDQLYRKDIEEAQGCTLHYETSMRQGGLRGAIATRANEVLLAQPENVREALPRLLRALVTVGQGATAPSARRAPLKQFQQGTPIRTLVEAFMQPTARLLVSDAQGDVTRIRVAHEALLTHWGTARHQIQNERSDLQARTRLELAENLWEEKGKLDDFLLPAGLPLSEAEDLINRRGNELEPDLVAFVSASSRKDKQRQEMQETKERRRFEERAEAAEELAREQTLRAEEARASERRLRQQASLRAFVDATRSRSEGNLKAMLAQFANALRLDATSVAGDAALNVLAWSLYHIPLGTQMRHEDAVSDVTFSRDGTQVLTGSRDQTARLWDAYTGQPTCQPMRHDAAVAIVDVSPDGTRILTGSYDKTARLWDARTGEPLGEPMLHEDWVSTVAFSPDGDRVLTGSRENGIAHLWDARTGQPLGVPMRHKAVVTAAAFSPDGTRVLTGSHDKTARLWDGRTGEPLGEPMSHGFWVVAAIFSPDGTQVLTGSWDKTARLWHARTGQPLGESMLHEAGVNSVAFSPDGTRVLTGSRDKTARLWDSRTGKAQGIILHWDAVSMVAFSPNGSRVLTADDKNVWLWDARTYQPLGTPMRHDRGLTAVAFSPDGTRVLTGSNDKTARLWDACTSPPTGEPMWHGAYVTAVAFSPDGTMAITGSSSETLADSYVENGYARLWDVRTGRPRGEPMPHDSDVTTVAFGPNGTAVLTGTYQHARLWSARTGQPLREPMRYEDGMTALALSPDGTQVLIGSHDKTARLWDWRTGQPLGEPMRHENGVSAVAFSTDGSRVLTAAGNSVWLWDSRTGQPLGEPMRHDDAVTAVALSQNATKVLTGSHDKTARLWDVRRCQPFGEPMRHEDTVTAVAFSPDGTRVLTGSYDKTARLWDARTGQPLGEPMQHDDAVTTIAFSPSGAQVLTGSRDKTARLWHIPYYQLIQAERIAALIESIGRMSVNELGAVVPLPDAGDRLEEQRKLASEIRLTDNSSDLDRIMVWLFSPPDIRTVNAWSTVRVAESQQNKSAVNNGSPLENYHK